MVSDDVRNPVRSENFYELRHGACWIKWRLAFEQAVQINHTMFIASADCKREAIAAGARSARRINERNVSCREIQRRRTLDHAGVSRGLERVCRNEATNVITPDAHVLGSILDRIGGQFPRDIRCWQAGVHFRDARNSPQLLLSNGQGRARRVIGAREWILAQHLLKGR